MQQLLRIAGTVCFLLGTYMSSYSQSLLHYWDFNTSTSEAALLTVTSSAITGASITHIPGGAGPSAIPITGNTTGQDFEVNNINARNGSVAGAHIRFNNPVGGTLLFALPTTGYEQIVAKYVTRRSGSGAATQVIAYSTDGTTYTNFSTITVTEVPTLQTLDFSSIAAASKIGRAHV